MPLASPFTWQSYLERRRTEDLDYLCKSEQFSALEKLFSGPETKTSTTLQQIAAEYLEPNLKEYAAKKADKDQRRVAFEGVLAKWSTPWRLLLDVVEFLADQNDNLVELVVAIQQLPDEDNISKSLPFFSECWAERTYNCKSAATHALFCRLRKG